MSAAIDNTNAAMQNRPHGHRPGRSPQSALESAQALLSGIPRPDGAESSPERGTLRRVQAAAFLESSRQAGYHLVFRDAGDWLVRLHSTEVAFGREHRTWKGAEVERIYKYTYPNQFGRTAFYGSGGLGNTDALPFEYLTRMALHNDIFGDDVVIECTLEDDRGWLVTVISQSFIEGDHPTQAQIDEYMTAEGFVKTRSEDWYRASDDIAAFDSHLGNFIFTPDGNVVPIDLVPIRHPDADHLFMLGVKLGVPPLGGRVSLGHLVNHEVEAALPPEGGTPNENPKS